MTTVSIEVSRPADEVFSYATDPTKFAEWQTGVISASMETDGLPALGDLCRTTRRIGRAERPSTSKLVRFEPPRAWSVQGIDGPIRARVDLDVEELAHDQTRVTIAVNFDGHGIGKILVPLVVRRQARNEMPANITCLKARIEANSPR
jgi:carbon monoxide dehydrogenase subunit G